MNNRLRNHRPRDTNPTNPTNERTPTSNEDAFVCRFSFVDFCLRKHHLIGGIHQSLLKLLLCSCPFVAVWNSINELIDERTNKTGKPQHQPAASLTFATSRLMRFTSFAPPPAIADPPIR